MKYYSRTITKRVQINRFGKLGYKPFIEYVKTNNIDQFNKGKHIKFTESETARKYLYHKLKDEVFTEPNY